MTHQSMTPEKLIQALQKGSVNFTQIIECIDDYYDFTSTQFQNGVQSNSAGSNNGSCKILAFAQLQGLSEAATLNALGAWFDYFGRTLNHLIWWAQAAGEHRE